MPLVWGDSYDSEKFVGCFEIRVFLLSKWLLSLGHYWLVAAMVQTIFFKIYVDKAREGE
jgi:hypothetical protein